MSEGENIFLKHVVPSLGAATCLAMYAAPFRPMLRAAHNESLGVRTCCVARLTVERLPGSHHSPRTDPPAGGFLCCSALQDIKPIPLSVTVANTLVWLVYALVKHDPYIAAPNAIGVTLSIFITTTAYGLAGKKVGSWVGGGGEAPSLPYPTPLCSHVPPSNRKPSGLHHLGLLQARQAVMAILTISFGVLPLLGVLTSFACKDRVAQLNLWYAWAGCGV